MIRDDGGARDKASKAISKQIQTAYTVDKNDHRIAVAEVD